MEVEYALTDLSLEVVPLCLDRCLCPISSRTCASPACLSLMRHDETLSMPRPELK